MNTEERKNFIIKTITEAEDEIKQSNEKLNDLKNKMQKIEEAIDIFESEDIPVTEAAYGTLCWIKSEINRETDTQNSLIKAIEILKIQHNL